MCLGGLSPGMGCSGGISLSVAQGGEHHYLAGEWGGGGRVLGQERTINSFFLRPWGGGTVSWSCQSPPLLSFAGLQGFTLFQTPFRDCKRLVTSRCSFGKFFLNQRLLCVLCWS